MVVMVRKTASAAPVKTQLRSILEGAHRRIRSGKGIPHGQSWQQVESGNREEWSRGQPEDELAGESDIAT